MSKAQSGLIKLALIGDNIKLSKTPLFHETAGRQTGLNVTYERLIPPEMGVSFDAVFEKVRTSGYRGVNVTLPYKEKVFASVRVHDPLVRAMGAINTVVFETDGPVGYNTDHSGFITAYKSVRGKTSPGKVCLIGTGGVGKAIAFGLTALGAEVIICVDLNLNKAEALANTLRALGSDTRIETSDNAVQSAKGANGIINCTPLGMDGYGGTPIAADAIYGADWAFDAVYTPVETQFLKDAKAAGLTIISGYELFFNQAVDAWQIFVGVPIDQAAIRAAIQEN